MCSDLRDKEFMFDYTYNLYKGFCYVSEVFIKKQKYLVLQTEEYKVVYKTLSKALQKRSKAIDCETSIIAIAKEADLDDQSLIELRNCIVRFKLDNGDPVGSWERYCDFLRYLDFCRDDKPKMQLVKMVLFIRATYIQSGYLPRIDFVLQEMLCACKELMDTDILQGICKYNKTR